MSQSTLLQRPPPWVANSGETRKHMLRQRALIPEEYVEHFRAVMYLDPEFILDSISALRYLGKYSFEALL
jgi:hypothetical protein